MAAVPAPRSLDKQSLEARAAGPAIVRRLGRLPLIGSTTRGLWRRWFEHQLDRDSRRVNAPAVEGFAAHRPALDAVQARVLSGLQERGIAVVSASELFPQGEPFASLQRAATDWIASPEIQQLERQYAAETVVGNSKAYLARMLGKGGALPWGPWLACAADARVLDIVNSYLGLHARMNYVDVWNTMPLERGGPDIGSQRWHRDPESPRLVKVFAYLSEVTADAGPFSYIPHSRPGERWGRLWPQEFPRGSNPPAGELEAAIPESEWLVMTAPAGTIVFADTAGFHRGGRATRVRRVMSVFNYVPPSSVWPRVFTVDPATLPAGLSPAARVALLS